MEQETLDATMEKDLKKTDEHDYSSLQAQVDAEYSIAYDHQNEKKAEALNRLKLYNNQRRDKSAVGDTTMFTIMQTIIASLYTDKLMVEWNGKEEGDDEVAENLNRLSESDYDEMGKDQTDYDWIWNTGFFGRGLCNLTEFVRDPDNNIFLPVPEVWDNLLFLRDPRAVAINGNTWTGKNGARFYGRDILMTHEAMETDKNFLAGLDFTTIKYGGGAKSMIDTAASARADSSGNTYTLNRKNERLGDNAEYEITEWYTQWKVSGEVHKVKVWLANNRKMVVGFKDLGSIEKPWGLIDRPLYPTANDWDGTSIPDLTEDKQRHRAVAANLGLRAMTADLYPNYVYDQNKIKNRNDLQFGFNKFIPVDGDPTSIIPMRKAAPNMQLLDFIYTTLDVSAQKATATPEIQQGQQSTEKRTLGELNIIQSKVDTRYSLSAKIFGWSERRFWQQDYRLYKENFADGIDKKIIRIVGAFGAKWRPLMRDNIIARLDPDVSIESKVLSRAKQLEDRQSLTGYFGLALQEPSANKRWALKKLGKLNGMTKDEMDRLFPPTIDEMQADDENDLLNKNEPVKVLAEQDHNVHLEMHSKANSTPAAIAHRETHKHALMMKRLHPEQFPSTDTSQMGNSMQPPAGSPNINQPPVKPMQPSQTSQQPSPVMQPK